MNDPKTLEPRQADESAPAEEHLFIGAGIDFADPNSPLARYYLRPVHVGVAVVFGLLFLLMNYVPLWHTDVWGHLKFGEWTVQHGRLPDGDPQCPFADPDAPALHYSWLSQCFLYVVYQAGASLAGGDALRQLAGGADALRFTLAVLVVLRCLVLLAAFLRLTGSLPTALGRLMVFILFSAGNLAVLRPQVTGELCFACVLFALSLPTLSRRGVFGLVLLFGVWANLHSSFAAGLLLLATVLLGRASETGWAATPPRWGKVTADLGVRRLFLALALSVAVIAVANPAGPWIYWNVVQMGTHPNVLAMDEWQPLAFHFGGGGHLAYLGIAFMLIAIALWQRRCYSFTALLLIVVFGLQPLRHQRMLVWWLMVAHWLALTLSKRGELPAEILAPGSWRVPSLRKTMLAALLVAVAVLWSIPVQDALSGQPTPLRRNLTAATPWPVTAHLLPGADTRAAPLPALEAGLAKHYPGGRFVGTVFASETLGDFFYWSLDADTPVFITTHVHLFTPEHWHECQMVRYGWVGWRAVLDRCGANLIVVEAERHGQLRELLRGDADWVIVLDETDSATKLDPRGRLLVALRKRPVARR